MRLIDADRYRDEMLKSREFNFFAILDMQPTVEPERKKGHWIKHYDDIFPEESTIECSECHNHQDITIDDNYCPNCGAEMVGSE